MTGSSLVVIFLPLIGAILGAIVGGFVGASANGPLRDREAKAAEDREREATLILLNQEVLANAASLYAVKEETHAEIIPNLNTHVWDGAQIRLAQLLPSELLKQLAYYYHHVKLVRSKPLRKFPEGYKEEVIDASKERGYQVLEDLQKMLKDPDYINARERLEDTD